MNPPEPEPEPGLREQKKAATRLALQRAALRMFEENGYGRTTVRDIAAAANVTERTFFRYFPSKEHLVFSEITDLLPPLCAEIRARPAGEPPLTAVLNALLALGEKRPETGLVLLFSGPPARFAPRASRPALAVLFDFEIGVAAALAERLGEHTGVSDGSPPSLRSAVLARAAVAAVRSAVIAHSDLGDVQPVPGSVNPLLREAFAVLGP
ncbi:TetR/AcrR family transcriptional regulator [Streptomyces sp. NBC_00859]|uniref:TetR/AcrR family transcriptional regulator n=1 Tax=Streptomyces sp. NBC_00859 TaxID=2903682 RepID=UPI00386F78DA|nr:TetR family transcriptional regulator [Streptomyces sp. NBC_00859]